MWVTRRGPGGCTGVGLALLGQLITQEDRAVGSCQCQALDPCGILAGAATSSFE